MSYITIYKATVGNKEEYYDSLEEDTESLNEQGFLPSSLIVKFYDLLKSQVMDSYISRLVYEREEGEESTTVEVFYYSIPA